MAQTQQGTELVKADLIADTSAITPGKPFTVGVRLVMAPDWHTYWKYSGDFGLPTEIDWQLPPGFKAGPIQWPVPERQVTGGDIVTFGYEHEVLLMAEITPPADLANAPVTLKAKASWLVCKESCVPGDAEVQLTLPVGPGGTFRQRRSLREVPRRVAARFRQDVRLHRLAGDWQKRNPLRIQRAQARRGKVIRFLSGAA